MPIDDARAPDVPLTRTTGYSGLSPYPNGGWLVPSDKPGFGNGLSLGEIEAMTLP